MAKITRQQRRKTERESKKDRSQVRREPYVPRNAKKTDLLKAGMDIARQITRHD